MYILHRGNGQIKSANGNYIRVGELETEPAITSDEAMKKWYDYLKIPVDEVRTFKSELMIVDKNEHKESEEQSQPALAYKIRLYIKNLSNTLIGYVDAHSGDICLTEPIALTSSGSTARKNLVENSMDIALAVPALLPSSASGTFATRYSGSRSATTELRSGLYYLEDGTRGDGIETLNLEDSNSADTTGAVSFSDNDNNWTSDEYDNDDYDNAALDVHWALQEVYDFFENEYSRSGWDSTGQKVNAYVHAIISGSRDNSAYYPGEYLAFGDGQSITYPFVSLDVVAHEYAHGINDHTSNFGASGLVRSFNEGLSDIWAAVIENDVAPEKENWKMFEEVMRDYDCDRNLHNPDDSGARTEIADTYGSDEYNSNTGEYYRSGIQSHWFYLLSEGGSGTNGIDNEYTVYGLGIETAADLIYHAQSKRYLNGTTTYPLMRTNMVNAANNLFGTNSFQSLQVANAWYAVGVGSYPGQVSISGHSVVCNSNTTFLLNAVDSGFTINWDCDTSVLTEVGDDDGSSYVVRANSSSTSGEGWVRVNIITGCGDTITRQQYFWVGELDENKIVCSREGQASGAWAQYHILCDEGSTYAVIGYDANGDGIEIGDQQTLAYKSITEYDWDVPSGWSWSDMNNSDVDNEEIEISPDWGTNPSPGDMVQIGVRVRNGCDWTSWVYDNWVVVTCSGGGLLLAITPNPASGETTLSIEWASEEKTFDEKVEWDLEIYSESQLLKEKKTSLRGQSTKIQTAGWEEGVYMVRVKYKNDILTGKLVVKR